MNYTEKFRPQNPKQLIGETQRKVATNLLKKVEEGKIVQEVLFSGDSGIGKTTIAKMYISAILGYPYDGAPFNCADKTGVDYIRDEVIGTMGFMPLDSDYRVYFLDEIHMLSQQAQNSLLVAIEPVPEHVLLVCCTTQPEKLITTLRSRLKEYHLTPPNISEFQVLTKWICKKLDKNIPDLLRDEIIGLAGGNVRQFVNYLEQALDGSYTSVEEIKQKQENLARLLMGYNAPNRADLFNAIDSSTDYVREAIGLSKYAIAIIKNPRSNGYSLKAAEIVLEILGNRPAKEIDSDVTFFNRLLEVYKRLQ